MAGVGGYASARPWANGMNGWETRTLEGAPSQSAASTIVAQFEGLPAALRPDSLVRGRRAGGTDFVLLSSLDEAASRKYFARTVGPQATVGSTAYSRLVSMILVSQGASLFRHEWAHVLDKAWLFATNPSLASPQLPIDLIRVVTSHGNTLEQWYESFIDEISPSMYGSDSRWGGGGIDEWFAEQTIGSFGYGGILSRVGNRIERVWEWFSRYDELLPARMFSMPQSVWRTPTVEVARDGFVAGQAGTMSSGWVRPETVSTALFPATASGDAVFHADGSVTLGQSSEARMLLCKPAGARSLRVQFVVDAPGAAGDPIGGNVAGRFDVDFAGSGQSVYRHWLRRRHPQSGTFVESFDLSVSGLQENRNAQIVVSSSSLPGTTQAGTRIYPARVFYA